MGEGLALDAAWLLAAFLVILVLAAAGIAARRFLLERGGGTVECGLRRQNGSWRLGVARYRGEELRWYGIFGLSVRPDEVFPRRDLTVVSRRLPTEAEAASLGPGMIVVECRLGEDTSQFGSGSGGGGPGAGDSQAAASGPGADSGPEASSDSDAASAGGLQAGAAEPPEPVTVELALGEAALTGLLSWLEASPPGSHLGIAI
ncbi:MAG TPA: DUF2550 domain-containing protein [Streptosporangiaceae bacterium]|nr:DUF2550 domain-containing protein [Streptosporangiaceae bacterium]